MSTRSFVQKLFCVPVIGFCPGTAWAGNDVPSPHALPDATMGEAYQYQLAAQGGVEPLQSSWTGDIPPGLQIDPPKGAGSGSVPETPTGRVTTPVWKERRPLHWAFFSS